VLNPWIIISYQPDENYSHSIGEQEKGLQMKKKGSKWFKKKTTTHLY